MNAPEKFDIDLGDGHWLEFVGWSPDRSIESNRVLYEGIPDVERFCAIIYHSKPDGTPCEGCVTFDGNVQRIVHPKVARWTVNVWHPLDLSPSVLCSCGDHGFIREGKWVRG